MKDLALAELYTLQATKHMVQLLGHFYDAATSERPAAYMIMIRGTIGMVEDELKNIKEALEGP